MDTDPFIRTIEWDMMNKAKFFPLSMLSSFTVRSALYPLTVIKTKLQVQFKNDTYSGMIDAGIKIYKTEGIRGLYKGFWVSSVQIVSGVFYITTYEGVKHFLTRLELGERTKAFIGGGCASMVGQTIIVPFDVVSQHMMVFGMRSQGKDDLNPLGLKINRSKSQMDICSEVFKKIMHKDGFQGFYRGYTASLLAYVPNSAMWWGFYHFYQDELYKVLPSWISQLFVQCVAGSLGGFTTTIITNPLDIIRARLQVQRINTMRGTFEELWREERLNMFIKGLSARLVQSAAFSFSIILGYETIKRLSVNEQYKHLIKW